MENPFIVMTEKSLRPPRFLHETFCAASKEAKRLADSVGQNYIVLEVVETAVPQLTEKKEEGRCAPIEVKVILKKPIAKPIAKPKK